MIKNFIFSLSSTACRSSALRSLSISQKIFSDELWTKSVQTELQYLTKKEKEANDYKTMVESSTQRWKEQFEIYYGKERDFTNFPTMKQPLYHPKVRLLIIPDAWFDALYNKTGVTGPYILFWGTVIFLQQKEIWVKDHAYAAFAPTVFALFLAHYWAGSKISAEVKKIMDRKSYFLAVRPAELYRKLATKKIEMANSSKVSSDLMVDLMKCANENVDLQLEVVYRNRLATVHKTVQRRLDYQVEKEVSKVRFQKQYMINWIVNKVIDDFASHEKAALSQCISDLRALGQKTAIGVPA